VPELPEVEAYRRLAERSVGRVVGRVELPDPWFLKGGLTPAMLGAALTGHRFAAFRRVGKLLLGDIDGGRRLGLRFGMTGTLVVDGRAALDGLLYAPARHDPAWERVRIAFVDGGSLVVRDPRRLGGVTLDPDLGRLGPDAAAITGDELAAALAGSTAPLKARLLDQSRVAGVGNLVADEVLWKAGLDPRRPAGSLAPTEVHLLCGTVHAVIADLVARGGSHRGDLTGERRRDGRCPQDGAPLTRSTVGGRTTWWCPVHQH
jgi:formamidopyrimidine-DNA glycosylase